MSNSKLKKIVEIKSVKKEYGDFRNSFTALKDINLDIYNGDFIGIMGPSGSGKSTLLNLIATIDEPTSGEIYINEKRIKTMQGGELSKFRRANIGFIFQDCNLLDTLTIRDNILAPLILAGIDKEESNKRLIDVSKRMEIEAILDKYPAECSGGQRQRAATCRALVSNTKIIVADEPTAALDTKNSTELLSLLKKLNEEDGITIIMVTHDTLIASYCSKVVMIRDGKLDGILNRNNEEQLNFYNKIMKETSKEVKNIFGKDNVNLGSEEKEEVKKIEAINNDEDYMEFLDRFGKLNKKYGINVIMARNEDNRVILGEESK